MADEIPTEQCETVELCIISVNKSLLYIKYCCAARYKMDQKSPQPGGQQRRETWSYITSYTHCSVLLFLYTASHFPLTSYTHCFVLFFLYTASRVLDSQFML